jgi:hypothetical protein
MLGCRFYLGKVVYNDEEHPGQQEPIISEELFLKAQARKRQKGVARTVTGPKGVLQGMISCGNCGKGIQSDRHRYGGPMYRERHAIECTTNNTSNMAHVVDEQIAAILKTVELHPDWMKRMAKLATARTDGPDPKELKKRRRRVGELYADAIISRAEYKARLAEIDRELSLTTTMELPKLEEAAHLFENVEELWNEATPEERRQLISPLIERVYVDMESRLVGAVEPVPAFRTLIDKAMKHTENSACMLLSQDDTERLQVWSWWRRGRVFWTQSINTVWVAGRDHHLDAYVISFNFDRFHEQPQELLTLLKCQFGQPKPDLLAERLKAA